MDRTSNRTILLPLDHGASEGMMPGLEDVGQFLQSVETAPINGTILHKGMARTFGPNLDPDMNLVVHLSAGTKHGLPAYNKALVCSVQEAVRLGADCLSVHINIGNDLEDRMLSDLGAVTDEAHQLGMPVLAMIYARGGQIVNELDPVLINHSIRIGAELDADMIKVPYSGDPESFTRAVSGCPVPVIIGGGPQKESFEEFLARIREALTTGIAGVSIGRNIFQHPDPLKAIKELAALVHEKKF
jgi:class I fructose-bisphosphate aldolase